MEAVDEFPDWRISNFARFSSLRKLTNYTKIGELNVPIIQYVHERICAGKFSLCILQHLTPRTVASKLWGEDFANFATRICWVPTLETTLEGWEKVGDSLLSLLVCWYRCIAIMPCDSSNYHFAQNTIFSYRFIAKFTCRDWGDKRLTIRRCELPATFSDELADY